MDSDGLDFALMVFQHTEGAEQAYSRRRGGSKTSRGRRRSRSSNTTGATGSSSGHVRRPIRGRRRRAGVHRAQDRRGRRGRGRGRAAVRSCRLAVGLVGGGMWAACPGELSRRICAARSSTRFARRFPKDPRRWSCWPPPSTSTRWSAALDGHHGRLVRHHLGAEEAQRSRRRSPTTPRPCRDPRPPRRPDQTSRLTTRSTRSSPSVRWVISSTVRSPAAANTSA